MPIRSTPLRTRRGRSVTAALLTAVVVSAVVAVPAAASAASVAGPVSENITAATLTEVDVPGTTALSAAAADLAAAGYTEREFYADGAAARYRGAVAGSTADATPIDGDFPYRTRVLVRAPQPDHFNGTLIVEWTNVTIGVDADFVFAEAHESLLREGYAYAVVSAQKVGVDRLKSWNPVRYGTLSVDASNVDPDDGGNIDDCGGDACAGDPLSWDVFTQTAAALTAEPGANPALPGLDVENVIATGQSQSASRLTAYYNSIQPLQGFFDGFVLWDRATAPLRSDIGVPAITVDSEGLSNAYPAFPTSASTRDWEVAGSTHGSLYAADYVDAMFNRDGSLIGPDGQPESFSDWVAPTCAVQPAFSTVPAGLVISAALDAVKRWIEQGVPAPATLLFDRDAEGTILRDADGRIEGGVRLSDFVVPTAEVSAFNGTTFPCFVSGWHRYYSAEELTERYGTHEDYVAQVRAAMEPLAADGYVLEADAQAVIAAADASDVAVGVATPTPTPAPTAPTGAPADPAQPPAAEASLANTGASIPAPFAAAALLIVLGGLTGLWAASRRRRLSLRAPR